MSPPMIRQAVEADAAELMRLASELGYPASLARIRARVARMIHSPNDCLLVAVGEGGQLAGWIHGFLCQLLEAEYRVEIGGLIVDRKIRRKGIGQRLVLAIEAWAIQKGATEVAVRCRVERPEAHQFYERLSFKYTKTQRVFGKEVALAGQSVSEADLRP